MKNANHNATATNGNNNRKQNEVLVGVPQNNREITNALKRAFVMGVSLEIPELELLVSPAGTTPSGCSQFTIYDGELQAFIGSSKGGGAFRYKQNEAVSRILDKSKNTLRGSVVYTTVVRWLRETPVPAKQEWFVQDFEFQIKDLRIWCNRQDCITYCHEVAKVANAEGYRTPRKECSGDQPVGLVTSFKRTERGVSVRFNFAPKGRTENADAVHNGDTLHAEMLGNALYDLIMSSANS